jgi:hypothetical protein
LLQRPPPSLLPSLRLIASQASTSSGLTTTPPTPTIASTSNTTSPIIIPPCAPRPIETSRYCLHCRAPTRPLSCRRWNNQPRGYRRRKRTTHRHHRSTLSHFNLPSPSFSGDRCLVSAYKPRSHASERFLTPPTSLRRLSFSKPPQQQLSANTIMARDELGEAAGVAAHVEDGIATPTLISPPESKTPPTATHKRNQAAFPSSLHDRNSEPIDPSALSRALEQFEQAGRVRERTPGASPSRKRARVYGDRYI